jgi:hypothetical protein
VNLPVPAEKIPCWMVLLHLSDHKVKTETSHEQVQVCEIKDDSSICFVRRRQMGAKG